MTFARYYKPAVMVVAAGVQVVNLDDEGLRIEFDVVRSATPSPDTCRIRIHGLSLPRRLAIREAHRVLGALPLQVHAGWDRVAKQIFTGLGTRVVVDVTLDGPGLVEVEAGDGAEGYSAAVLEFSTFGITPLELVQLYCAPALVEPIPGLTARTFPSATVLLSPNAIAVLTAAGATTVGTFANGYAFSGMARDLMDEVCRTCGARWWIADGVLEVVVRGAPVPGPAIVVSPSTGLIIAKPIDLDGIAVEALLEPDALPGRLLVVLDELGAPVGESAYRIEASRMIGDTAPGGSFRMSLAARAELTPAELALV
jgi:hypothetical protein